jgi:hypothetical protein
VRFLSAGRHGRAAFQIDAIAVIQIGYPRPAHRDNHPDRQTRFAQVDEQNAGFADDHTLIILHDQCAVLVDAVGQLLAGQLGCADQTPDAAALKEVLIDHAPVEKAKALADAEAVVIVFC